MERWALVLKRARQFVSKHPDLTVMAAVLIFILLFVCAAYYSNVLFYDYDTTGSNVATGLGMHQSVSHTLVRYDGGHYTDIASLGYSRETDAAFLPLYPLLIRAVHTLSGLSYYWSALVVAWTALVAAAVLLRRWAAFEIRTLKLRVSPWAVLGVMAIFPTAVYFALPYTEGLFLLVNLGAILAFRQQRYLVATILAGLAAATRYQGLVLPVLFVGDFLLHKYDFKKLLPIIGTIAGFGGYMLFLHNHYGSALEFLTAEKSWGRLSGGFVSTLIQTMRPDYLWFFTVLAVGLWFVWRRLGPLYAVYSLAFLLEPLSSGSLDSINRYMVSLVPLFLALAISMQPAKQQWWRLSYVASSAFLMCWTISLFANNYWVA